jgi:hypothetical protein
MHVDDVGDKRIRTVTVVDIGLGVLTFNVTFNIISVISWRLVLLVEETGVPTNHQTTDCRRSLTNFIT